MKDVQTVSQRLENPSSFIWFKTLYGEQVHKHLSVGHQQEG